MFSWSYDIERRTPQQAVVRGDGPGREGLEAAISARNLSDHVSLLGFQRDIGGLLEQADREANTKVNALNAQMKQANDRQKAQIEKRIAQVKADHAARKAKLDQARKLTAEALKP